MNGILIRDITRVIISLDTALASVDLQPPQDMMITFSPEFGIRKES